MREVTVKVQELLAIIERNREGHRNLFLEAQKEYREQVIQVLERNLQLAREGRPVPVSFHFNVPQDHTRDYDRVITMLRMHQGETIDIEETEFSQYVMDDWKWKNQFLSNEYVGSALTKMGQPG